MPEHVRLLALCCSLSLLGGSAWAAPLPAASPLLDAAAAPFGLERTTPREAGLDPKALERLVRSAEESRTSGLVLLRNGKVVVDRTFDAPGPIPTMSVTKSIVSLAVGALIADGKIPGLDAPLSTWFPEWKEGPKAQVTLRHVLTQTSGLAHEQGARALYAQKDTMAYVRALPLAEEPGRKFSYSNEGVQLLSGVISAAAGKPVDAYLDARLFRPLGIKPGGWQKDGAGTPHTFADLSLSPRDLAKLGQLLLQGGVWKGRRLLPAEWIATSTRPTRDDLPWYGLLWWVRRPPGQVGISPEKLGLLEGAGFSAAAKLAPLKGQAFAPGAAFWLEAGTLLDAEERARLAKLQQQGLSPLAEKASPQIGFYADGWLGQVLVVYPEEGVVAVRMRRATDGNDDAENRKYGFNAFMPLVEATFARPATAPSRRPTPETTAESPE